MKLEDNVANKIAELFNTVMVWEDMARIALDKGELEKYNANRRMADDALMELDSEFGIELPHTVYAYRRWTKRNELTF